MLNAPKTYTFPTSEEYLRALHPEYDFVFELAENARDRWHYDEKRASQTQIHMIENALEVALRADHERGIEIIIVPTETQTDVLSLSMLA